MAQYSASDYRTKLKEDFETWTDRHVLVRDQAGTLLADGILTGFKHRSALALGPAGHANMPGGAIYGFASGGPVTGDELTWEPTQIIEVVEHTNEDPEPASMPNKRPTAEAHPSGIDQVTVDMNPIPDTELDRSTVIRNALSAVGVGATTMSDFAAATDVIVAKESAWNPNAVTPAGSSDYRPMADGAPFPSQRGLTQLTPWAFVEHHVTGTSHRIYDPVANVAAAWHLIAAVWNVDLRTGRGLAEFVAGVRAQPGHWFGDRRN